MVQHDAVLLCAVFVVTVCSDGTPTVCGVNLGQSTQTVSSVELGRKGRLAASYEQACPRVCNVLLTGGRERCSASQQKMGTEDWSDGFCSTHEGRRQGSFLCPYLSAFAILFKGISWSPDVYLTRP